MSALLNLTKELNKLHFPSLQLTEHGCLEHFPWWPSGVIDGEVSVKANSGTQNATSQKTLLKCKCYCLNIYAIIK